MPSFYEFFAGGGMVRAGLGPGWTCLFANDFDAKKARTYEANWGAGGELRVGDVGGLTVADLPGRPDLVWGSFPCQDLSLAGAGAGLEGERSGSFYPFWRLVRGLIAEGRGPRIIALENVVGALTSKGGADFAALCAALGEAGYRYGALVINAELFLPQSRPRLFIIGVAADVALDPDLVAPGPIGAFHPPALARAPAEMLWWNLPAPPRRNSGLADLIEAEPTGIVWHTAAETDRLLALMAPQHRAKVEAAKKAGRRMVGGVYRRTRPDPDGGRRQRAEVRFDDTAGCLRTPAGGSSRQVIMVVEGERVRTRLLSPRETARLMGLSDDYALPANANAAFHLTGDGVAVPVVRFLAEQLFEPLLAGA